MSGLNWGAAVGGIALAAGVAFAGIEVGSSLIDMKRAARTVTVKGLSEREVQADIVNWRIPFRGVADDRTAAIAEAGRARAALLDFARDGGLSGEETSVEPFTLRIERGFNGNVEIVRYIAVGAVRLRTTNVDAIETLTGETQTLLDAGVLLGDTDYGQAAQPEFLFTGLNAIKPELIAEATAAARESAQQFAKDSGATVGDIADANQGVIQILPRDGEYNERNERNKIVRVVSTVSYYLDD